MISEKNLCNYTIQELRLYAQILGIKGATALPKKKVIEMVTKAINDNVVLTSRPKENLLSELFGTKFPSCFETLAECIVLILSADFDRLIKKQILTKLLTIQSSMKSDGRDASYIKCIENLVEQM